MLIGPAADQGMGSGEFLARILNCAGTGERCLVQLLHPGMGSKEAEPFALTHSDANRFIAEFNKKSLKPHRTSPIATIPNRDG
jgi:hypothetical protein